MRFFILLLLFLVSGAAVFAQGRVRGKVLEEKSYIAVGGVTVENLNNHATNVSTAAGEFSIVAKPGDVISFTSLGYKRDSVLVRDMGVLTVYLIPEQNLLNEVRVKEIEFPPGAFAMPPMLGPMGSRVVRYQTDKSGNPIGGVKMNLFDLFGSSKNSEQAKKEKREKEEQIAVVFSAATLGKYLPITGQELTNFIILYMPDVKTFYDPNFNITDYINTSYRKFMQMPVEKRRSKTEFALK